MKNDYKVGNTVYKGGCFTFEGYIKGQNLFVIAKRLGLPQAVVSKGIYIAYALRTPAMSEFELAGTTLDSTDKFITYGKGTATYNHQKFQKLYTKNAAIPVNFQDIKKQYHRTFGQNKLVKVLAPSFKEYPAGGMTPELFMKSKLPCYIAAYIPPNGNFR